MLPGFFQAPAAVILLVGGLLSCFFGYRLFRLVLGIYGFIVGAFVGNSIVGATEVLPMVLAALGGGAIGALASYAAYYGGVAILGAGLGAALVSVGAAQIGREPSLLVFVAVSIVGAVVALLLQRYVIIVATACGGAWSILVGALALSGEAGGAAGALRGDSWLRLPLSSVHGPPWVLLVWIALGLAGTLVQLRTSRRR